MELPTASCKLPTLLFIAIAIAIFSKLSELSKLAQLSIALPIPQNILRAARTYRILKTMKIGQLEIAIPVLMAPLAGITDSVFRLLAKEHGAGLVYTEMISAEGLVHGGVKTYSLIEFEQRERPIGVQIFGSRPEAMGRAAMLVTEMRPELIDLNFGCPARKVVGKNGGAALLKDLDLIEKIVRAVIMATDLPVTVKIRSGWDEKSIVAKEVASMCACYGVSAITVHPRTRQQGFSGTACWDLIRQVKESVEIPVIGNGDIRTPRDGLRMCQETGCDAIMIGRGALGNPWLFQQIRDLLQGRDPAEPTLDERIDLCLRHARELVDNKGSRRGVHQMRKHLGWYTKGFPEGARLRRAVVTLERLEDVEQVFRNYQHKWAGRSLCSTVLAEKAN